MTANEVINQGWTEVYYLTGDSCASDWSAWVWVPCKFIEQGYPNHLYVDFTGLRKKVDVSTCRRPLDADVLRFQQRELERGVEA